MYFSISYEEITVHSAVIDVDSIEEAWERLEEAKGTDGLPTIKSIVDNDIVTELEADDFEFLPTYE